MLCTSTVWNCDLVYSAKNELEQFLSATQSYVVPDVSMIYRYLYDIIFVRDWSICISWQKMNGYLYPEHMWHDVSMAQKV